MKEKMGYSEIRKEFPNLDEESIKKIENKIENTIKENLYDKTPGMEKIYNKDTVHPVIKKAIEESIKEHIPTSIVAVDFDNLGGLNKYFKNVHQEADKVMTEIMENIINENILKQDGYLMRSGGDEYFAVFPGKTKEEVFEIMNKIEDEVNKYVKENGYDKILSPKLNNLKTGIGISWGIVDYNPKYPELKNYEEIMKLADRFQGKYKEEKVKYLKKEVI